MFRINTFSSHSWTPIILFVRLSVNSPHDCKALLTAELLTNTFLFYMSYAVHPNFKSHTGWVMKMGQGAIQLGSNKQKLVTRSTCEAELVGADNASTKIFWTKLFLEAQGYEVRENILYQDNKSTILLWNNGKWRFTFIGNKERYPVSEENLYLGYRNWRYIQETIVRRYYGLYLFKIIKIYRPTVKTYSIHKWSLV